MKPARHALQDAAGKRFPAFPRLQRHNLQGILGGAAGPHGHAPQTMQRNRKAMETVLAEDTDAVCVVHGGVIAGFMMTWFGGLRVDWYRKAGTGYQVTFEGGVPTRWVRVPEDI